MGLTIRPLTRDTVPLYARLVTRLYQEDPGPVPITFERAQAQAEEMLKHPDRVTAQLLEHEGQCIGYALLVLCYSNEYGGDIVYLDEFYILPELQGRGLGTRYLDQLKAWATERRLYRISLEVYEGNKRAARLYERAGFETDGRAVYGFQLRPLE